VTVPAEPFAARLAAGLASYGTEPFIEFEGVWHTGDDISTYGDRLAAALFDAGVAPADPIGVVVRNRLPHAAVILGFIATGRPVVMIYSYQSERAIAGDVGGLQLAAVIADRDDWTEPVLSAAHRAGTAAVAVSATEPRVELLAVRGEPHAPHKDPALREAGIHILTSGTTGPPRRVLIRTAVLEHTVRSITHGQLVSSGDPPDIVFWPFGSIGVCQLLAPALTRKRMVLLEKFTVADWVRAVKTYRVRRRSAADHRADVTRRRRAEVRSRIARVPGGRIGPTGAGHP
jgi:acyl-CoA synthetase (AMP-forming)/AMP-acid ligase II